jgi:CubicO group peptidase (beta-lactamase class C family)
MVKRIGMIIGLFLGVILLVGLGLYIVMPKPPKPPDNINTIGELEAYLEQVVAVGRPPGLSVAVVKDGEIVYANGFGIADSPRNIVASKDTIYHWWSMTKIPTAVAIMQLHERGQLDVNDPVKNYLPYFIVYLDGKEYENITIRQLLNHSSGLPDAVPELFTWVHLEGESSINQTKLVVEKFPKYNELVYTPGEKTRYSNFGYMVLGALIEAVTHQTYEEYIADNILLPLGMENTNFIYNDQMAKNEAAGSQHWVDMYTPFFPLLKLNYLIRETEGMRFWFQRVYNDQTPPTGLIGPVTDVGQFTIAYLRNGGDLLRPETISLMNAELESLSQPGESGQGLGWQVYLTHTGRRYLSHSGGGPGFATIFRIYPEENMGVVVMGNDSTIDRDALVDVLANMEW